MRLITVTLRGAVLGKDEEPRQLQIITEGTMEDEEFPSGEPGLKALKMYYRSQAMKIWRAMKYTLPQGLTDALMGVMMRDKASLFVIPEDE